MLPSDSVTEEALLGGFDDNTFFDLRQNANRVQRPARHRPDLCRAARLKAYRDLIAEAEKNLKATEKEKEQPRKEAAFAAQPTPLPTWRRIEDLKKKNAENLLQARADSVSLTQKRPLLDESRLRLQRRRDRLSALDRKN